MNPDNRLLELGILVAGLVGNWAVMKYRIDRGEKDREDEKKAYTSQLDKLWTWKDRHEDEASKERLSIYSGIAKLQGAWEATSTSLTNLGTQATSIMESIKSMQQDLADLKAEKRARDRE